MAQTLIASPQTEPGLFETPSAAPWLPKWVDVREIDANQFYPPEPRPNSAAQLFAAAKSQLDALTPASTAERQAVLFGMRSSTILLPESEGEAEATMKILIAHLDNVPLDIFRTACRGYVNRPQKNFFPKSAGELRVLIDPLINQRKIRAYRLSQMANQAKAADEKRARDAIVVEIPLAEIAAMTPEFRKMGLSKGWITQEQIDQAEKLQSQTA